MKYDLSKWNPFKFMRKTSDEKRNESQAPLALATAAGGMPATWPDLSRLFSADPFRLMQETLRDPAFIADADKQHIGDFLSATTDEMRAHPPCNIILDMRFNTGGDYTKAARFASHLPDFVPPGGRIYLLTGPQTFSAAITTNGATR